MHLLSLLFELWRACSLFFLSLFSGASEHALDKKLAPLTATPSPWEYDLTQARSANQTLNECSKNAIITFIMPSSGSRSSIEASVSSLLALSSCHWRLIIVYSTATASPSQLETCPPMQLSRYSQAFERDPRIFYLPYQRKSMFNYGGNSRNAAFKHSTTEWIGFVDDDDQLSPDYLTILAEESRLHANVSVVLFRMSCRSCFQQVIPPVPYPALKPNYAGGLSQEREREGEREMTP